VAAQDIRLPFGAGEKLSYTVHWRLLPAGIAELVVSADRSAPGRWKATAKAHSVGYVSNIYRVEDEYQSQFRNPGFCSSGIHKQIQEGNRHRDVKLEFDPRRRLARLEDRDMLDHTPPKIEQFAIPECVQDILSAVYYARSLPMTVGQSFEFPLNDGAKTIQIHVEVQASSRPSASSPTFSPATCSAARAACSSGLQRMRAESRCSSGLRSAWEPSPQHSLKLGERSRN